MSGPAAVEDGRAAAGGGVAIAAATSMPVRTAIAAAVVALRDIAASLDDLIPRARR
jgi:hypothetical protein